MPWPKGKPRKGYKKPEADPTATSPALHGMVGSGPISEPCPKCMYAYADGGYCPECGWTRGYRVDEYGSNVGMRF